MKYTLKIPSVKKLFKDFVKRFDPRVVNKHLTDPREQNHIKHKFSLMMDTVIEGLLGGCVTLRSLEQLSESRENRISDTALHDLLVKMDPSELQAYLAKEVKAASRNHIIENQLPVNVVAIDGKSQQVTSYEVDNTSQKCGENKYNHRVLRAMHVSGKVPMFMAQHCIDATQSELSSFKSLLKTLVNHYAGTKLLDVFTLDAGFTCPDNATLIAESNYRYVMAVKKNTGNFYQEIVQATNCLIPDEVVIEETTSTTTKFMLTKAVISHKKWSSATHVFKLEKHTCKKGAKTHKVADIRYFITNIPQNKLSDKQLINIIRRHWFIENKGFGTLDFSFQEDSYPITSRAFAFIGLLRMLLTNFFAHFRIKKLKAILGKKIVSLKDIFKVVALAFHESFLKQKLPTTQ